MTRPGGGADRVGDCDPVGAVFASGVHYVEHPLRRGGSVERAVPGGGDDHLDARPGVVGNRGDVGDLRGGLGAAASDVGAAVAVGSRHHVPSERKPAAMARWAPFGLATSAENSMSG